MGPVAGPPIVRRITNHTGANRIEFNVSQAGQKIVISLHEAGTEPPLKQSTTAGIRIIEMPHVAPAQRLHQTRYGIIHPRCYQQMDMVCHKDPSVDIDTKPGRPILQPVSIGRDVSIAGEQRLAVVSSLNDVDRIAHRTQSESPRQALYPFSRK